jgi:O-antigen/teichoic acid export membrane protein
VGSVTAVTDPTHSPVRGATARYLRESSLLVVGKTVAQAVEFGLQLFAVRYFSKTAFGALGYALSIVFLFRAIALFEMPLALARYIPSYREKRRPDEVLGSIVLGVGVVLGIGTLLALLVAGGVGLLHVQPTSSELALQLLIILAVFIPLDALDILLTALFAVFGRPRVIFFRQVVLGPLSRVMLVTAVVTTGASVTGFAVGYVLASAATLLVYGVLFVVCLKQDGMFSAGAAAPARRSYPARETFTFALPMLVSTLVWLLLDSSDGILLGHFKGLREVAAFRAVLPLAFLNQGIILAATALYSPVLARLLVRGERKEAAKLYWRSTLWITVASLPMFIITFAFAPAVTTTVLGEQYASSAPVMAVLAVGYFFHSALGFNGLTLRVLGRVRYSVGIDIAAAVANVAVNLMLIPRYGALGAAIGTSATLVVHNLLKQEGLRRYAGMRFLEPAYIPTYVAILVTAVGLFALEQVHPQSIWVVLPLSAAAGVVVAWMSRHLLELQHVFPEMRRLRLIPGRAES